ncbi:uncharacterized protein CCOS01_07931 [Colletotrichum costaricense]|uniref:AA1-like domain-containing protein n=1 Tax=Colletotrichum costaricense TaxID=1209916 RepID=A0AAJ0E0L7_9PEZI|nr:uncharacterized protein CCOS01_07931 [Colletotrichum costaricense]KAK1527669.1 hypothetical protein CCOS01_07931 [Colletotrichum costaricense]
MKLSLLLIAVPAAQAAVSYMSAVPDKLMAMVEASEDCNLPDDFQIQNFTAESADGKTADSLDFTFNDDSTVLNTQCHLNASSVPVSGDGRTPRYACDNASVQFIWQNGTITVIEKVCPGDDGAADYEASGTAAVPLVCDGGAANGTGNAARSHRRARRAAVACKSNSDDIRSRFFSIQPASIHIAHEMMEIEVIHTCSQHSGPKGSAGLQEGEKTRPVDSFSRGMTAQSQVLPRQPQGKRATQDQPFVGKRRLAAPLRIFHGRHAVLSTFFTAASLNSLQVSLWMTE